MVEQPPVSNTNRYGALADLTQLAPEQNPSTESKALGAQPTVRRESAGQSSHPKPKCGNQPRRSTTRTSQADEDQEEVETSLEAQQVYDRPHQASYFIPGRVEGRPVQFLLDTGCTTNLLGKHVFDRLPERVKAERKEYARHGLLADGTRLPFYGIIRLSMRLRQVKTEEVFIISQISEDAILGMPFLVERRCAMDFKRPVLKIDGQEVKCTDRQGRLLANSIQAVRQEVLPPESEKTILCRVTSHNYCPLGIVEALSEGIPIAASLNQPNQKGQILVRCLNPSKTPLELKSGVVIGTYTGIEEGEVESPPSVDTMSGPATEAEVPEHVKTCMSLLGKKLQLPGLKEAASCAPEEIWTHL